MSFPRYPKYKASGVEWLGEVPDEWRVLSLKRVVNPVRQITYGIVQAGPHVPDGVPYIRPADMTAEDGIKAPDEIMRTSDDIAANYTRSTIRAGDIVCSIGPSFGKVMITPAWLDGANLTQGTARIAVQREHNPRYIFWTLRAPASVGQWVSSVGGATFSALNLGPLARTTILIPSLPEQTAIAEFLDRETGKIDGLVAEQRRLMELLKEKRQAVISHAVTKGLNPHAPMKPSGIEWLGDVPEGWEVKPLRYAFYCLDGRRIPLNGTQRAEKQGTIPYWGANSIVDYVDESLFDEDLVLLGEDGAPFFDKSKPIAFFSTGKVWPNNHVHVLRPAVADTGKFIAYALNVTDYAHFVDGSTRDKLTQGAMKEIPVPFPPVAEQTATVAFLDTELAKFDTLTAEAQRAIDLLQERRTALISAAVTGQIDVRQHPKN